MRLESSKDITNYEGQPCPQCQEPMGARRVYTSSAGWHCGCKVKKETKTGVSAK